ncbi:hypothetical protein SAMN05880501_104120 [Ureibacillus xyleni]|uniref:Uncharacterized protein n=1 Tax=Ureibacillus xyleni TaxID=614648 RepID=A0A285SIW3_9BACL|nr:hypothetical protein [Ureibacillus xyleni]SOC05819.1 hypothetical protein SAMN05880501_104120 [Ureibacillus xyleni]
MYYFYHPRYFHSPYAPISYRPVHQRPSVDHRLLQQTPNPSNQNPYPPVDPNYLYQSANETKKLMKDASLVLDRLASSKDFDEKLMNHAQLSESEEVKRLIKSIGITSDVEAVYNPDSLRLEFISHHSNSECCRLSIVLKWR